MESRVTKAEARLDELFERQRQFDERQKTMAATLSAIVMTLEELQTEFRYQRGEPSPSTVMGRTPPATPKLLGADDIQPRPSGEESIQEQLRGPVPPFIPIPPFIPPPPTPPPATALRRQHPPATPTILGAVDNHSTSSGDESIQAQHRGQGRLIALSVFTGDDPIGWANRAELVFTLNGTREKFITDSEVKVSLVPSILPYSSVAPAKKTRNGDFHVTGPRFGSRLLEVANNVEYELQGEGVPPYSPASAKKTSESGFFVPGSLPMLHPSPDPGGGQ